MFEIDTDSYHDDLIVTHYDLLFQFHDRSGIYDGPSTRIALLRRFHDALISSGKQNHLAYVGALYLLGMEPFRQASKCPNVMDPTDAAMSILLPGLTSDDRMLAKEYVEDWKATWPPGASVFPASVLNQFERVHLDYWLHELGGNERYPEPVKVEAVKLFNLSGD